MVNVKSSKINPCKPTSIVELIQFYGNILYNKLIILGITMNIESTFGNSSHNLRTHFNQLSEKNGSTQKLGQRRFETLKSALNPSIEELQQLVNILVSNCTK